MQRLLKSISLVSLLALPGCTTWEQVQHGVQSFQGQHYKQAIATLGFPDEERRVAGHTVYIWRNESSGSYTVPTTSTASTYVGGKYINTTVYGSERRSFNHNCELKLVTNSAGIVVDGELEGNLGGCGHYARYAPKKKGA